MTFQEIKKILKKKTVGIAGAGGLGSNCAVALARVGVGKIIIADFDRITRKNLNRQYYFYEQVGQKKVFAIEDNILFINPKVKVEAHDTRLNPKKIKCIYKHCDIIVEAFDQAEMKQMIIETVQSDMPNIPLIIGSGMAGWGNNNSIKTRQIDNLYICGDEQSEIADDLPPLAPRVGIVAHMQANMALEILLKNQRNNENNTQ
ncbi:MAG: sulfur carrier protein ThiS adenylyltransferase ThiF [Bacteroidetes bacterium]|nr:sulfur carrier protein ThiS adenylyltransferase ThiF [Bacteroidota bacterium]